MDSPSQIDTKGLQTDLEGQPSTSNLLEEEGNDLDKNVERQIQLERLKTIKEYNRTLSQNNEERKKYAGSIFKLTCTWAFLIFVIIFLQGFKIMFLSDKVLITLITSTTINFFGFFLLVVKYLFNTAPNKKGLKQKSKTKIES